MWLATSPGSGQTQKVLVKPSREHISSIIAQRLDHSESVGVLFDDQMTFNLDYDDVRGVGYIANRHPRPCEAASYSPSLYPSGFVGHSVVAYLPKPSHNGNMIILAGTDSDATGAAAEFLTSEEQLKKFRDTLRVQKFPYFEVLIETSCLSGASFNSEILAHRTYPTLR